LPLRKRKLFFIIVIAVFLAAYLIYIRMGSQALIETLATGTANNENELVFPAPGQTLYKMGLYLDTSRRTMYGNTVLLTRNTSGQALSELWFTVYPNAFKDSRHSPAPSEAYYAGFNEGYLDFQEFKVNGQKVEYFPDGVSLQVVLPRDIVPGEDIKIEMQWQAQIPKLAYRYGNKGGIYMLGNFYPTLNVLGRDGWHNSYNSAFGDPFCFHCADYQVSLSLPEGFLMVSTGSKRETIAEDNGREVHFIEAQNVRDFCLAVLYDYKESIYGQNRPQIICYSPAKQSELAGQILKQSAQILNYYACSWGSYPYLDFKIVFVPMRGFHGMEYSGLIFLSEEFLQPRTYKDHGEFILAHEIAHQWWYGMVGNDQLKEPWLDEGLANWSAYKYLKEYRGIEPACGSEFQNGINLAQEMREIVSRQEYYRMAYSGGEAFWFALEKEMGEDTVNKVLRRYLADFRFKVASTDDLLLVIKKEARRDMSDYFHKWSLDKPVSD